MRRKILMAFFVALAGMFVFASGVKADTIQKINVSADNKISSLLPTTVYKNPGNTYIGIGRCSTYGDDITRYLAKFDTSSLDKTKDIKSAIFKIDRVSQTWDNDAATPYNLHHITSAYDSSTVHWSTSPSYDAAQAVLGVKKDYGIFDFDITNSVKEWINGTTTDHSILIKKQDEEAIKFPAYTCVYGSFASTDYSSSGAETRPYLEVTYYDPSIAVLSPNGGETMTVGKTYPLKWIIKNYPTEKGGLAYLRMVNTNTGGEYQVVDAGIDNNNESFINWTIPTSLPAGAYKFKVRVVSNAKDLVLEDFSDATFTITTETENLPDLTIGEIQVGVIENGQFIQRTPQNSERFVLRTQVKNIGSANFSSGDFQIYWNIPNSNTGSRSYQSSIDAGSWLWYLLPFSEGTGIVNGNYVATITSDFQNLIKESNENNNTTAIDFIVGATTITPSITVLYLNGGEEIHEGTTQKIVWSAKNFSGLNVSIDLIDNSGYVTNIASNISNTGYYYWNTAAGVKGGYLSGYSYKIRISSNDKGPSAVDDSNSYFRIIPATTEISIPSIAVLSPNGGETLSIGNVYDIKFRATQKGSAYIQLLKEDKFVGYIHDYIGSPYDIIGQQVYKWKVPSSSIPGNDYKIRVMKPGPSGSVGENIIDDSDAPFSIVATDASALKVDLKINNSDNPKPIVYNSKFTASWSSSGASYCTGYGIDVIAENGGVWTSGKYPASGSKTLYAKSVSGSTPFSTFHLGLQCWDDFGKSVVDLIENIPTVLPITGVTPIKEGSVVKIQGVPDVYVIKDGQKVKINSPQEFEQKGYKWDQIQTVQADLLAQIAELKAQVKQLKEDLAKAGALLKSMTGPDVYVIVDGKKEKIQDPETFNKRGYKWNQIQSVSQEDLESIPEYAPSAQQTATAPALPQGIIPGSLVKSPNSPAVYYITPTGAKKHILNSKVFNSYNNKWDNVRTVSQDEINASPTVNAFRIGNESKVYFISDGQKQWVKTPEAFAKKGLKWDQIVSVNKTEIDEYKEGEEIE